MHSDISKAAAASRRPIGAPPGLVCAAVLSLALVALTACGPGPTRTIRAAALESAAPVAPSDPRRCLLADPEALRPLYQPLNAHLGLVEVRSQHDWDVLAESAPGIGRCPDLSRGIVVGLASQVGTPLQADWPVRWEAIRIEKGAGLIEASFNAGNYFPNGTTYLETAYVEDLSAVLVVAVDGVWYYPRPGESMSR